MERRSKAPEQLICQILYWLAVRSPKSNVDDSADHAAVQDEAMKNLMMSWYYAGYYTGLYEGQQKALQTQATYSSS